MIFSLLSALLLSTSAQADETAAPAVIDERKYAFRQMIRLEFPHPTPDDLKKARCGWDAAFLAPVYSSCYSDDRKSVKLLFFSNTFFSHLK
jgi:hypothetical protein